MGKKILSIILSLVGLLMFLSLYVIVIVNEADYIKYVVTALGYVAVVVFAMGIIMLKANFTKKKEK